MSEVLKPAARMRGKGTIQNWGSEDTKNGNLQLWFAVAGEYLSPPDTFGDEFLRVPPWITRVSMTLVQGGGDKNNWVFDALQKITGDPDIDLERMDQTHPEAYDIEGKEVTVLFAEKEYKGRVSLQAGFLWPKPKGKLNRFGADLMAYRARQLQEEQAVDPVDPAPVPVDVDTVFVPETTPKRKRKSAS